MSETRGISSKKSRRSSAKPGKRRKPKSKPKTRYSFGRVHCPTCGAIYGPRAWISATQKAAAV